MNDFRVRQERRVDLSPVAPFRAGLPTGGTADLCQAVFQGIERRLTLEEMRRNFTFGLLFHYAQKWVGHRSLVVTGLRTFCSFQLFSLVGTLGFSIYHYLEGEGDVQLLGDTIAEGLFLVASASVGTASAQMKLPAMRPEKKLALAGLLTSSPVFVGSVQTVSATTPQLDKERLGRWIVEQLRALGWRDPPYPNAAEFPSPRVYSFERDLVRRERQTFHRDTEHFLGRVGEERYGIRMVMNLLDAEASAGNKRYRLCSRWILREGQHSLELEVQRIFSRRLGHRSVFLRRSRFQFDPESGGLLGDSSVETSHFADGPFRLTLRHPEHARIHRTLWISQAALGFPGVSRGIRTGSLSADEGFFDRWGPVMDEAPLLRELSEVGRMPRHFGSLRELTTYCRGRGIRHYSTRQRGEALLVAFQLAEASLAPGATCPPMTLQMVHQFDRQGRFVFYGLVEVYGLTPSHAYGLWWSPRHWVSEPPVTPQALREIDF